MSENNNTKLVEDIALFSEKYLGKEKYFLSSEKKSKYLKITKNQYYLFKIIIPLLNGENSKKEIQDKIIKKYNKKIDIDNVVEFLKRNDLFDDISSIERCRVEIDLYAKKIRAFSLDWINTFDTAEMKNLIKIIFGCSLICIILFMTKSFLGFEDIKNIFIKGRIDWHNTNLLKVSYIYFIGWCSLFFHEIGHILAAKYHNVRLKNLNIVLQFGIIPSFYVDYHGLYETSSKVKVKILLSGVYVNILLVSIFGLLYFATFRWEFMVIVLLNIYDVMNNISPLSLSDGYYIFTIVSGTEGFRWGVVSMLRDVIIRKVKVKDIFQKKYIYFFLYFIISMLFTFEIMIHLLYGVFAFFSLNLDSEVYALIIVAVICVKFIIRISISINKLKKTAG